MKLCKRLRLRSQMHLLLATIVISVGMSSFGFAAESLQNLYQTPAPPPKGVTVFVAKDIVTISPVVKSVTAIAVRDGIIVDVGDREKLLARFKQSKELKVDEIFSKRGMSGKKECTWCCRSCSQSLDRRRSSIQELEVEKATIASTLTAYWLAIFFYAMIDTYTNDPQI